MNADLRYRSAYARGCARLTAPPYRMCFEANGTVILITTPVLRLARLLIERLGCFDVESTEADHALSIEETEGRLLLRRDGGEEIPCRTFGEVLFPHLAHLFDEVYLRAENRLVIHASSLAANGKGLLLMGLSGAGKTTTALALARAGYGFLADDVSIVTRAEPAAIVANPVGIKIRRCDVAAGEESDPDARQYFVNPTAVEGVRVADPAPLAAALLIERPSDAAPAVRDSSPLEHVDTIRRLIIPPAAREAGIAGLLEIVDRVPFGVASPRAGENPEGFVRLVDWWFAKHRARRVPS